MTRKKPVAAEPKKRPYRTPKITPHGDLRTMTQSKGGSSSDGSGKPATRTFGANG